MKPDPLDLTAFILHALYWPCALALLAIVMYGLYQFITCGACP